MMELALSLAYRLFVRWNYYLGVFCIRGRPIFLRVSAAVLAETKPSSSSMSLNLRPETASFAYLNVFPFLGVWKPARLPSDDFLTSR